jgi:hypothetical protein
VTETRPRTGEPTEAALVRENRFFRRMLDDQDRQCAALQDEMSALKGDWAWRALGFLRLAARRIRRQFRQTPAEEAEARRNGRQPAARGAGN